MVLCSYCQRDGSELFRKSNEGKYSSHEMAQGGSGYFQEKELFLYWELVERRHVVFICAKG